MPVAQSDLVRCSKCRRDYELTPFAACCPACGGASWVAARIAERDSDAFRGDAVAAGL
jgi:rRNA maturation endonuclease Nob1